MYSTAISPRVSGKTRDSGSHSTINWVWKDLAGSLKKIPWTTNIGIEPIQSVG